MGVEEWARRMDASRKKAVEASRSADESLAEHHAVLSEGIADFIYLVQEMPAFDAERPMESLGRSDLEKELRQWREWSKKLL